MNNYKSIDKSNMFKSIFDFPDQIDDALEIGKLISLKNDYADIKNIVVAGMGGSAIGGDIAKLLSKNELSIPLIISRNYHLPNWVNAETLVICCSYSGNTEETLSSFNDALISNAKIIGISTGGELSLKIKDRSLDLIEIPAGLQPRAALALSFIPILCLFKNLGIVPSGTVLRLKASIDYLKGLRDEYSQELDLNYSYSLAKKIYKTIPIIYGENQSTAAIAVRWKGQLCENGKMLSYHSELPEMNHNEIVGWENNIKKMAGLSAIWLRDESDNPRTLIRQDSTIEIIKNLPSNNEIVKVDGKNTIERYLGLIHLGDWVSFWCAILHDTDPTPVKKIDELKAILSEKS